MAENSVVIHSEGFVSCTYTNSLSLKNSKEFVQKLIPILYVKAFVISLNVKDLYSSLRKSLLLHHVCDPLADNIVTLQSEVGIAVDEFLALLDVHLSSAVSTCIDHVLYT